MELDSCIDKIISGDKKEIKIYEYYFLITLCISIGLLIYNWKNNYIKDNAIYIANALSFLIGVIPINIIIKRKRRIVIFNEIIRSGIAEKDENNIKYKELVFKTLEEINK